MLLDNTKYNLSLPQKRGTYYFTLFCGSWLIRYNTFFIEMISFKTLNNDIGSITYL